MTSSSKLRSARKVAIRSGAAIVAATAVIGLAPATVLAQPAKSPMPETLPDVNTPTDMLHSLPLPQVPALPVESAANSPEGAPVPTAYRPDQLANFYNSDVATDEWFYFYVVNPFVKVQNEHPEILDQNLEITVAVNNSAKDDPQRQERALADALDDLLVTMSDSFGANLGAAFRQSLAEGRLPKTEALLSGNLARAGGIASSTFAEKYAYGYDRPFVVAPDRIQRYNREGGKDPYGTTPAYPSGHTNKATWTAALLSVMLPELAPQIQARSAEVGYNRLTMGVHYALDVMGGRMMGNQAAADRWADPQFRPLIEEAATEIRAELEWRCGDSLQNCIAKDTPYMSNGDAVNYYTKLMTYDFPQIGEKNVPVQVPERYASLLETRFPQLTEEQRNQVLAATAIESGYPLDRNDGVGQHVRINMARAMAAQVTVNADGSLNIVG